MQLVINKRGAKISVEEGLFKIRAGDALQKVPVTRVSAIMLQKSASITTDAILQAVENEIDIIFAHRTGQVWGRVWSHKYGSISTIRKNQVSFSRSKDGVKWVIDNLARKMDNQIALLLTLGRPDRATDQKIQQATAKINAGKQKMLALTYTTMLDVAQKLRSYEGACAKWYFNTISMHLPEPYRFAGRSQHPAFDMFNALLNYAYGMLYGQVEAALIKAGVDPYLGIFHRDEYNRPVLVYDFIERFRMWADYVVVHLCMQQIVFIEFFEVENQVYYLNHHGKRILIQSFNDYFEEVIELHGQPRSRARHIVGQAQQLAAKLKSYHHD